MNIDVKAKEMLETHSKVLKPPTDLVETLSDLKVLGRREYANLLRMHHKFQNIVRNSTVKEESKVATEEVDEEAALDKQLEETIKRIEKDKKR